MRNKVFRNASVLFVSQIITWGLTLVLSVLLPRYLGAVATGQFYLANSLWVIVALFVGFGMDTLLVKEAVRRPEELGRFLGTSLGVRAGFFVIGAGGLILFAYLAGYSSEIILLILIMGVTHLLMQVAGSFRAGLTGLERMEFISLADISSKFVRSVVVVCLLLLGQNVFVIAGATVLSTFVNTLIVGLSLRYLKVPKLQFDWQLAKQMPGRGSPFFMAEIFRTVYDQIDIVILSLLVSETVVGWYGVADTLFGSLMFIPSIFVMALFPSLTRMFTENPEKLFSVMDRAFNLLLVLGIPIGLGQLVVANNAIRLLFGEDFTAAGPVLATMGIVLVLTYQNTLLGYFLFAIDQQKKIAYLIFIAMLLTVPLDLILVPWCQKTFGNGAIGGALSFIVTELIIFFGGLRALPRKALRWENARTGLLAAFSGLGMVLASWWVKDQMIVIPIVVGAVVYGLFVLTFRLIPAEDWDLLLSLGKRVFFRLRLIRT